MTKCIICNEETDSKEFGICLECEQKIFTALDMKVEYSDDDIKITPKEKEPLYDLVCALSNLASTVDYNFHAISHHSHRTKEVEVVNIE